MPGFRLSLSMAFRIGFLDKRNHRRINRHGVRIGTSARQANTPESRLAPKKAIDFMICNLD
jgi:hypothetical protein